MKAVEKFKEVTPDLVLMDITMRHVHDQPDIFLTLDRSPVAAKALKLCRLDIDVLHRARSCHPHLH